MVKLPMKLPCDWGTKHPAIVAIWCYLKVSRVSTICANSQWCLASNSQYNASCCGFLLWSCHQRSWWGIDLGNFKHKQPKSFPNISGSDKKNGQKNDSALFGCWNTKLFDAPRPHHPSPGCPKTCRAFFKRRGKCDWCLWPLTTWHLGNWWRLVPSDHKEYVRPRCCFWVRTRISRILSCLFDQTREMIHVFQSMSWTEQTHNLCIRMKRQTRGMIKFKILVDTSRNPFFCPYQFWLSNHGSHGVSNKITTPLTWSCKFLCSASFGSFSNMIFLCFSPVFLVLLVCWCLLGSIRALFPHQMPLLKTNAAWISERSSAGFVSETQIKSASSKKWYKIIIYLLGSFSSFPKNMLDHVGLPNGKAEPSASWTSRWRASQRLKLESEFSRVTAPIFGEKDWKNTKSRGKPQVNDVRSSLCPA